ncbi:hypothetical protein [Simkania sp.]|uniref:hypothetical protein n=1 Tax=Simkania sp. TaxID=34094 RepID=UPI003B52DDB7
MVSYVSQAISWTWETLYPTTHVEIDLNEIDPYTTETFQALQNERFENGNAYYICLVKEEGRTYLFDAELFILDCIKAGNQIVANPLSRHPIGNFEIYVSTPQEPRFKFDMGNEALKPENRIPIFLTDSGFTDIDRRFLIETRAGKLMKKDKVEEAKRLYLIASEMGSVSAKLSLAHLYTKEGKDENAVQLFSYCFENEVDKINVHNVLLSAKLLWDLKAYSLAVKFYQVAAIRESQYGLAFLINILEGEQETHFPKDLTQAKEWRQKLPPEWREKPIAEYFAHLSACACAK